MTKLFSRAGRLLCFFLPLILGMAGLWALAGEPFLDALFCCVSMYVLNYGDTPPNLLVELARWLAPVTTAGGILLALRSIRDQACGLLHCLLGDGVAVYGPEAERDLLAGRLGRRGVAGSDELIPARQYILLGDGAERFSLCARILQKRPQADIFLQCADIPPQSVSSPRLHLFSPEETAARLFWRESCLYACSARHGHRLRVVLLGFGSLGENLLRYGLLDNIFDPAQRIEYHIFGADSRFAAVHSQLERLEDPVVFHDGPWWDSLELIRSAHLALLLPQEGQAAAARDLLLAAPGLRTVIFASRESDAALLAGQDGLELFPWLELALEPDLILQDALFAQAKAINLRYAHLYGGAEENESSREEEWRRLDAFTRYSNVSCADYHAVRLSMLEAMGLPADADRLPPETLELLAELEHIRWCRYHYLNNWRPGTPPNGKRKDPASRVHADLVPYSQLDEPAKEKDRENLRVLLSAVR